MKKVLSVMAVSAFVLTAGVALAGGGKKMGPGCPEACQQQIDDLNSSQAQQNELLNAHGKQLKNHEGRITALEKAFDDYWYFRLGAGAAWLNADNDFAESLGFDTDFDAGWTGRIAFGREFAMYNAPGRFRAELEFGYQANDFDLGQSQIGLIIQQNSRDLAMDTYTFMVNGYYELPVADAFSLYAMAGVGVAHLSADGQIWENGGWVDVDDDGSTAFAYKAGLGVTYNFTNEIAADLGYEYLGVADVDGFSDINSSNVVASVRFKF